MIDDRGHELRIEFPESRVNVSGDRGRLMQVFGDILHNATKYTDPNGRIELSVNVEHGMTVIKIHDTGSGIPAEMLGNIFEAFTQVNRTIDRAQGGLGIGLTLVKTLVELHGEAVEARSKGEGQGSEFIVRLPLVDLDAGVNLEDALSMPRHNNADIQVPRRRILIVDDLKP